MNNIVEKAEYKKLLEAIKERLYKAQYDALKKVNKEHIALCWYIGEKIVEKQQIYNWGKSIVENLSKDLQKEFPGIQGFSMRNLWNMRSFFITYKDNKKMQPLVAEISWVKNVIIISKCKEDLEREFYIRMTKKFGWTKDVLIHQVENQSYEKYLLNQTNFDKVVPDKYRHQAKLAVKDEYTFDFLELGDEHSERELEIEILNKIRKFLIEMGGYFSFIGNQYRVEVGGDEFFVDLLLFHRKLKCLVAVELKIGKFKPDYAGQMQFYLSVLDDKVKLEEENPSIGIIVCKSKDRTIVEYTLKDVSKPVGGSTYKISRSLPKEMKQYLPAPDEIEKRLAELISSPGTKKVEIEEGAGEQK
ncbi:MAG: PDDEXK nuclease domain-containing protein [Candidatus Aminicenantes bacterium]|nr:PDDEXK nuclease domain-containing protein [Candidatus Aminicenantes bacterium]